MFHSVDYSICCHCPWLPKTPWCSFWRIWCHSDLNKVVWITFELSWHWKSGENRKYNLTWNCVTLDLINYTQTVSPKPQVICTRPFVHVVVEKVKECVLVLISIFKIKLWNISLERPVLKVTSCSLINLEYIKEAKQISGKFSVHEENWGAEKIASCHKSMKAWFQSSEFTHKW